MKEEWEKQKAKDTAAITQFFRGNKEGSEIMTALVSTLLQSAYQTGYHDSQMGFECRMSAVVNAQNGS